MWKLTYWAPLVYNCSHRWIVYNSKAIVSWCSMTVVKHIVKYDARDSKSNLIMSEEFFDKDWAVILFRNVEHSRNQFRTGIDSVQFRELDQHITSDSHSTSDRVSSISGIGRNSVQFRNRNQFPEFRNRWESVGIPCNSGIGVSSRNSGIGGNR